MDVLDQSRTLVVCGIPDLLSASRMADKLFIHFQRAKSRGGDVQAIRYPTGFKGVAFVTFDRVQDAERVLTQNQLMEDREFPASYPLTVFKFSPDVFFFVRAEVDLSVFSDPHQLIRTLKATHRSVRVSPLSYKAAVEVEGPFLAVKKLREDLVRRAQVSSNPTGRKGPESQVALGEMASEGAVGGSQDGSAWVDTTVFRYVQQFHSRKIDRCLLDHCVTISSQEVGDVTLLTLSGTVPSSLRTAIVDLELLVETIQSTLCTQKIGYGGGDDRHIEAVLHLCNDTNQICKDVLLIPRESGVEVVGPSNSVHIFCTMVEDRMHLSSGQMIQERSSHTSPVSHM